MGKRENCCKTTTAKLRLRVIGCIGSRLLQPAELGMQILLAKQDDAQTVISIFVQRNFVFPHS